MAEFKEYTKYAASYCPKLPGIVFNRAMLSAAREYFTQTQSWKETVLINTVAESDTYNIPAPVGTDLIDTIDRVTLNNKDLTPLPFEYNNENAGTPLYFATPTKSTMRFYPIPDESAAVTVTLNLKPAFTTTEMPDAIFNEHFEGLLAGCIAEIKRMPGDWYDPQAASMHRREFEQLIDKKRIELMRGSNNANVGIQYPSFT